MVPVLPRASPAPAPGALAAAAPGVRSCCRDSSMIPGSEPVRKMSFKNKIRQASSFMLRGQYFPKLPAGQNKKFIFNSILLNFATGELFVPTGVWKGSRLHYIPFLSRPSASPPPRRRLCSRPAFSSSCLHPRDMSGHWSLRPTELRERGEKTDSP